MGHMVAAQGLTSKVVWKSSPLAEKQHANVWHFPGTLLPDLRQQSAVTLSMCTISTNCICIQKGGLCPIYQWGTSRSLVNNSQCSQGKQWKEDDFLRRKLIPGGLQHLNKREVAPDTPEDPSRSAVLWTLLTRWAKVRMFKSARGTWQFHVPGACDIFQVPGALTFI